MNLSVGTELQNGKYRIIRVLGQGGFGITYLALDVSLDREVAIKEFFPRDYCDREGVTSHVTLGTQSSAQFVNRLKAKFLKEAKNIAKFDHPGIIRIHAAFEENNTAYYVMDFIDGESLSAIVKRDGPLPQEKALKYIGQVAEALKYVHGYRINHLDVKPANIMIRRRDDRPILIDFGLSKQYDSEGNQTSTTPTGISHGFAPIEQYNDGGVREFSPQTDLYSLAATLYYLLSGEIPPHAPSLINNELTFPDSIPACLRNPIAKAMSMACRDRHNTIAEFINEINDDCATKIIAEPEPKPKPTPDPEPKPKSTTETENGHEWVDLGLPSGTKWATCNVGASSPSDYGDYFAWGETSPKSSYDESNSKTYGKCIGNISGKSEYDAARANWGGNWRLPTKTECEELCSRCKWKWTTLGGKRGKKGYKVVGPNGNSIFLPAAGYRFGTTLNRDCTYGYWSGKPYWSEGAYNIWFNENNHYVDKDYRRFGLSIRPVTE